MASETNEDDWIVAIFFCKTNENGQKKIGGNQLEGRLPKQKQMIYQKLKNAKVNLLSEIGT